VNNVLIIGAGKVGLATGKALSDAVDYHDPFKGIVNDDFEKYEYIIVCVDTIQSGPKDYQDLEKVLDQIDATGFGGLVVIRSTVSPEKVYYWNKEYSFSYILFPEFMPQRDGRLISDNAWIVVLGGDQSHAKAFADDVLFTYNYPAHPDAYNYVSKDEAAIIKLANNAALATKLIYFNTIYKICKDFGASYESVRQAISMDHRINGEHSIVPSPDDNKLGFGGHCLPKDLLAIADLDKLGLFDTIDAINKKLR
jgi:UDP-glucose 6-dehydrogenase